jgi:hypothetical protein
MPHAPHPPWSPLFSEQIDGLRARFADPDHHERDIPRIAGAWVPLVAENDAVMVLDGLRLS